MTYYNFINGLRGLSIAFVVIFHLFPQILPGGFIGVDVFFVISGFLITSIIWEKIQNNKFSFTEFYANRIRRLLPVALFVYFITFVIAFFILMPDVFRFFGRSLTAAVLFYSNHYFYGNTGYFSGPIYEKPLLHTWSLSVEEQFYIIWPLLIFAVFFLASKYLRTKHTKPLIISLSIAILLSSLAYAQFLIPIDKSKAFYLLTARAWELMLGASLALTIKNIDLSKIQAEVLAGLGLIAIILSAVLLNEKSDFPGLSALPACLGTAFIICACIKQKTVTEYIFSNKALIFLGLISYSLYLWHWPFLTLTHNYLERHLTPLEASMIIVFSIFISFLSWKYIEQPFRKKKAYFYLPNSLAIQRGAAAMGALAILGIIIYGLHGFPWRIDGKIRDVYQQMSKANDRRKTCDGFHKAFKNDEFCNFGVKKAPEISFDIALFGDSKADHYVPMLSEYAKKNNLSGRQITQSGGCGAILEVKVTYWKEKRKRNCLNLQKTFIEFVEKNSNLKLVILAGSWSTFNNDYQIQKQTLKLPKQLHEKLKNENLKPGTFLYHTRLTIEFLLNRGIAVHIIGDIPTYRHIGALPLKCIRRAYKNNQKPNCGIPTKYKQVLKRSNNLFEQLEPQYENLSVFIPTKTICNDKLCNAMIDNIFLYRDLGHLNAYGSKKMLEHANLPKLPNSKEN